jgi:hypothetical protein
LRERGGAYLVVNHIGEDTGEHGGAVVMSCSDSFPSARIFVQLKERVEGERESG